VPEDIAGSLANALPQILFTASREGAVTFVNRCWTEVTGLSEEACLGSGWVSSLHPDDRDRVVSAWNTAIAESREGAVRTRLKYRDGAYRMTIFQYRPISSPNGQVDLWIGAVIELEEQVRLEEAMRESEAGYRYIVERATEGIWIIDQNGLTEYINDRGAEILGYTAAEMMGRSPVDFFHPEDREAAAQRIHHRPQRNSTLEVRYRRKDGSAIWAHLSRSPFLDADGKHLGTLGMFSDITDRKLAEAKLRESSEALEVLFWRLLEVQESERRFVARELHDEIGQILTAVSINLHATKNLTTTDARKRLDECLSIVDRAIQQVRSMSLELRPSMLDDLGLDAALRWYADRQSQRTGVAIQLSVHIPVRLPPEIETTCFRIVQEALANTFEHAAAKHVWVAIDRQPELVELVIQDDGVGFDVEAARERFAAGVNIGLLGMHERVRLLGGEMVIESAPAEGTEIRLQIPIASSAQRQKECR
jgi:PAS domain S-box-containing protein